MDQEIKTKWMKVLTLIEKGDMMDDDSSAEEIFQLMAEIKKEKAIKRAREIGISNDDIKFALKTREEFMKIAKDFGLKDFTIMKGGVIDTTPGY